MSSNTHNGSQDSDTSIATSRPGLKRPPMYKVIILNDDYTPMDFVVTILERFFTMNREKATRIMIQVHTSGAGVCGVFSRDIAETRVAQVENYSSQHNHPLKCTMEVA